MKRTAEHLHLWILFVYSVAEGPRDSSKALVHCSTDWRTHGFLCDDAESDLHTNAARFQETTKTLKCIFALLSSDFIHFVWKPLCHRTWWMSCQILAWRELVPSETVPSYLCSLIRHLIIAIQLASVQLEVWVDRELDRTANIHRELNHCAYHCHGNLSRSSQPSQWSESQIVQTWWVLICCELKEPGIQIRTMILMHKHSIIAMNHHVWCAFMESLARVNCIPTYAQI